MYKAESSFLKSVEAASFTSIENTIGIFITSDTVSQESLVQFGKKIIDDLSYEKPDSLKVFEARISAFFQTEEIIITAAAFCMIVKDVCYLVTKEKGAVYLLRENNLGTLITADKTASGFCMDGDLFILGTDSLLSDISAPELIDASLNKSPKELVAILEAYAVEHGKKTMQALFILLTKQDTIFIDSKNERLPIFTSAAPKSKKITFLIVMILVIVLTWSVVFGYQRRAHTELMKRVTASKETIEQKLSEATDVATLNIDTSQTLLSEAKQEYTNLKKIVGKNKIKEVDALGQKIKETDDILLKKEDRKSEEYYDLGLIKKSASAVDMYLEGEDVVLLNSAEGEYYTLSLTKKSVQTVKAIEARSAKFIAIYDDTAFLYIPEKSIYKKDTDGKVQLVIKDENWNKIVDFALYNGNMYVLDAGKNDIYKYLVAENGYSDATSYFKGSIPDLSDATSLVIDGSLYLTTSDSAYKFTAGLKDEFAVNIPDKENSTFNTIFTSPDASSVYILDTKKSKVYVLSKSGEYEKQIESSIFSKAADMVVLESENGIFVLVKEKIYKVALE